MAVIRAKSGTSVTVGSFAGGYPTQTTWGGSITPVDPGIPLAQYATTPTDPLKLWKTQPSLRKVVGFAARQFAMVAWHAYQRVDDTDRQRLASSPLEKALSHPEPHVSGYQLRAGLATDLMVFDMCCAVLVDDEIVRVPPSLLSVKSDYLGRVRQILIKTPTGLNDIDITEAPKIMTWGWHPTGAGGVSPMHTLSALLEENMRAVQWRTHQWRAVPKVAGFLKRPSSQKKWDPVQRERFLEDWRAWRTNTGAGTPILEDGMEYVEAGAALSPKNAQDIEGRRLTDAEVASAFFIPPELVGARAGNFSNIDAFRQMLFGPTLGPMFVQIQEAVNIGGIIEALDVTPDVYVEANREAAMAGSFFEQVRLLQTATGGPFMTRAEARSRLNLPHIPGTDELVTPLNVIIGDQASPSDSGDQNVGGDNADPDAREDQP
jgi:phage portal protein BeeE